MLQVFPAKKHWLLPKEFCESRVLNCWTFSTPIFDLKAWLNKYVINCGNMRGMNALKTNYIRLYKAKQMSTTLPLKVTKSRDCCNPCCVNRGTNHGHCWCFLHRSCGHPLWKASPSWRVQGPAQTRSRRTRRNHSTAACQSMAPRRNLWSTSLSCTERYRCQHGDATTVEVCQVCCGFFPPH